MTGGMSGIHEKDSVISSVISAAHRKTKLSSSSMKTSAADDSGKRAKKDIVSLRLQPVDHIRFKNVQKE
jgi:hypothetical protein